MPSIVVVPATPLLVRGAAGAADPLATVRDTVRQVLRRQLDGADRVSVLATGPRQRAGRLRPTLAGAGIPDSRVGLRDGVDAADATTDGTGDGVAWEGVAATGASVALLALGDAGMDLRAQPVDTVELPGEATGALVTAVARRLGGVSGPDLLVVADHPAPGVDAVVEAITADGGWERDELEVPQGHEHLPPTYRITVLRSR